MSLQEYFGQWDQQAHLIDASGRWSGWATAQPALAEVGSASALAAAVMDRGRPFQANELLLALVRVGSTDGGEDEAAATFTACLLVPGGDRIIRSLRSLGPDVDAVVGGQLWLQVREYPWRCRPRAVAKNALMETRRAVLKDYGVTTARRAAPLSLAPTDLTEVLDRNAASAPNAEVDPAPDVALLELLTWARTRGVLQPVEAELLWDLVLTANEQDVPGGQARGVSSIQAGAAVAAARGVTARTVQRQRDRAVGRLRSATNGYEMTPA